MQRHVQRVLDPNQLDLPPLAGDIFFAAGMQVLQARRAASAGLSGGLLGRGSQQPEGKPHSRKGLRYLEWALNLPSSIFSRKLNKY
ncbi:MAG: hypothetical protein L0387_06645 [Acidobacteria bacterium]|nr:hypothetical protein [Acidobacteriota bacterium]MCI0720122.1 hypothetical protein [Acidobacteriota bacterium]